MGTGQIEMTKEGVHSAEPRPLRISYLLSQFPVATEVFAVSDIVALRELGHQVVVHTMKPRPKNETARLKLCGVPEDLPVLRPTWAGALRWPLILWRRRVEVASLCRGILAAARSNPVTALTAFLSIPRVVEIVEETRKCESDVVHVFWARHAGLVLQALRTASGRAVRTAFVGAYDLVADDFLVDLTLGAAEVIFSHAEANRPYVRTKAPRDVPVQIIPRGIPLAVIGDDGKRDACSWVTASALVQSKNVEAVLHAFAVARRKQPKSKLKVFGEGPDRQRLANITADLGCCDAVQFVGHVPREQLFGEMRHAALFILLSKKPSERLPNVVKEALWAGCAVITSKSEGIEELIPDPSYGLVVDSDDPQAIEAAVDSVQRESKTEAAERRRKARRLIQERFSSARSMQRYLEVWRTAMGSRHGRDQVAGLEAAAPVLTRLTAR